MIGFAMFTEGKEAGRPFSINR